MEFKVLGPLGATHEGAPVSLGGPKQQTVLGILLVHAGEVVSADRLIEEVWGDSPPSSARRTLQSFVANLRKALNRDDEILQGRAPGYILDVDLDRVDSTVFAATLDDASALAPENPRQAAEMLRRGLAMWRGRPFAGLTDHAPTLHAEMVRLDELRITAVEQRIDCDLAVGEHLKLIAELEYLATEYPLRERIWHQLMTAQYRSGRQADALRSYQKARHVLAGELGIEPGRELQQLEEAILLGDSALTAKVHPEASDGKAESPHTGQSIRGYELRELVVESGEHGAVFRAYQHALGREVALTALDASLANKPDFVRQFDESIRRIARLEHPHVVPIYDFWRNPGGAFVISRWVRGVNLRVAIDRGPWRKDAALQAIEQVGDAISLAHRRGLAPLQLTSEDIVVDDKGNTHVSLIQRGLASRLRGRTGIGVEDANRQSLRDDTRALGVILLEMLTGAPCPNGEAERQTWMLEHLEHLPGEANGELKGMIRRAVRDVDDAFERPDELLSAIATMRSSAIAPIVRPDETAANPFKGLRPFNEADAEDFFGRDALIEQLIEALGEGNKRNLVAVVGPSGSGKSSAVRAGLLPAVRANAIPCSASWFVATMVPGRYPFEELEAALLRIAVDPAPGLLDLLSSDASGLRRALKQTVPTDDGDLLLVIDQMEELFTGADERSSTLFIDSLVNAVVDPQARIRVVVTLRADFYDRPLHHPELGRLMHDGLVSVVPLTPTELQQAITGPARRVGVEVEPDLVGQLIGDVSDRAGALPLLQYVLTELFDAREDRRLTLQSYLEMGGMSAALGSRAEGVFTQLTEPARHAAQQLFLRLVSIERTAKETRNRVSRRSLATVTDGAAMNQAIDAFAEARLLSFDADPVSGLPTVEVAHEAIFSAWPRLEEWIDGSRAALDAQRRLGAAAADWIEHARDTDYLASGRRLAEFSSVVADGQVAPSPLERDYVAASRARAETARRNRSRVRFGITAALLLAVVITAALAILAMVQRRAAEADARTALARELAAESVAALEVDPELSVLLALEAIGTTLEVDGAVLPRAEEALHMSLLRNRLIRTIPDAVVGDFGDGGDLYAAADDAGRVRLWNLSSGLVQELPEPHLDRVSALTFSSGGDQLASSSEDGTVKLWDLGTGVVRTFRGHFGPVLDVDISPDGRLLASTSVDGTARVWDLRGDTSEELLIEPNASAAVAFDPAGQRLAVVDPFEPEVRIVDATTGEDITVLSQDSLIVDVAFVDDGSLLATATIDGTATLWDVANGKVVLTYGVKSTDLALHQRSQTLATAGADGMVRVWDITTGVEVLRLAGHRGQVNSVSFDQGGTRLASAGVDGTARIWNISPEGSREVAALTGIARPMSVGFSRDTRYLAATGDLGAMIWDTDEWTVQHELPGALAVAVSPEGSSFAVVGDERVVTLRSMSSGDEFLESGLRLEERATGYLTAVAFTTDGSSLITGDAIGTVQVWETSSGRAIVTMPGSHFGAVAGLELDAASNHLLSVDTGPLGSVFVWDLRNALIVSAPEPEAGLTAAALSPDGSVVLTGGPDGATRAWSATTGQALEVPLMEQPGTVRGIAYSPDGETVATAGDDGAIRLWNATTGTLVMGFPAHVDGTTDIVYSSDGRFLASIGNDGTTRVFFAQIDDLVELAEARVARSLTHDECLRYLPLESC